MAVDVMAVDVAEGLAELQGMAQAVDMELTPDSFDPAAMAGGPDLQAGPDYGQEAAQCVDMFAALVCGYAPAAEVVWTEPARQRVAGALAPVLSKYGVTLGNIPPELVLGLVAGPMLWQSAKIVAQQVEGDKRQAAARRGEEGQRQVMAANPAPGPDVPAGPGQNPQMALYVGK